jgi:hypothetical protein
MQTDLLWNQKPKSTLTQIMKIAIFKKNQANPTPFNGTVSELIEHLGLKGRTDIMYTLTSKPRNGIFQFRAWFGPFASINDFHVDTGTTEKVFEIVSERGGDIVTAIVPTWAFASGWAVARR